MAIFERLAIRCGFNRMLWTAFSVPKVLASLRRLAPDACHPLEPMTLVSISGLSVSATQGCMHHIEILLNIPSEHPTHLDRGQAFPQS